MITLLKPNQIFVYGSNLEGKHAAGAAKQAHEQFGAEWGLGVGLSGQSYAIPTMHGFHTLKAYVNQFLEFAQTKPELEFLVTPIGCGIAGFKPEEIAPLFRDAPDNVVLPKEFNSKKGKTNV